MQISTIIILLPLLVGLTVLGGCNTDDDCRDCIPAEAPVTLNEGAKYPNDINDFIRLTFLRPDASFSGRLGPPEAKYTFIGPTRFYQPPLPVQLLARYPGLSYRADRTLYAIRCQPDDAALSPLLATWPNVYSAIKTDLGPDHVCPAPPGSGENALYCLIKDFDDIPDVVSSYSVQRALNVAVQLFADPDIVKVLQSRYGIYQEFSGLGFSVKTYGNYDPMPARVVLENSLVPEYLARNVTLPEGGCRCIRVEPYAGRENDLLDPDFITEAGSPECATVNGLRRAR